MELVNGLPQRILSGKNIYNHIFINKKQLMNNSLTVFLYHYTTSDYATANHTNTTVNGHSVNADVPSGAKFTDTLYMHPSYSQRASGIYKFAVDGWGHVTTAKQ